MNTANSQLTSEITSPFTFGLVPYMNAVPLLFRLPQVAPNATMIQKAPRELAGMVLNGTLDAALVPVADVLANSGLQLLTNIGIGARGPVKSVMILSKVPMDSIRNIQLDPESSTSNQLARIIMQHHFHRKVEFVPGLQSEGRAWPPDAPSGSSVINTQTAGPSAPPYPIHSDAEVIIGDRALQRNGSGIWQCDLSEAWQAMTGLPFVFAVWATRLNHPRLSDLAAIAEESLRRGQSELAFIARQQALRLRLPSALCLEYLTKIIHYSLDDRDQEAMNSFRTYINNQLTPSGALV